MSAGDVQTITTLIEQNPHMNRAALSRLLCELWQWRKPNGELKDMTCRVALLRMGLASKILSKVARQLPKDWMMRYGFAPVLLETFVEFERHKGTCYKAANWTLVGRTAGRGKKSKSNKPLIPVKDIWLYPLRRDWQGVLCC
jgi:hypothetical protein